MTGKAFIWDLDGTLLDSYGVIVSSLRQTLEELNVPMDESEIRRLATEGSVSDVVRRAAAETRRTFQEIKDRYSEISGGRYQEITAMPHAREALEETAALGAVHFVYTHRGRTTAPVLEQLGLDRLFIEVVSRLPPEARPRRPALPAGEAPLGAGPGFLRGRPDPGRGLREKRRSPKRSLCPLRGRDGGSCDSGSAGGPGHRGDMRGGPPVPFRHFVHGRNCHDAAGKRRPPLV